MSDSAIQQVAQAIHDANYVAILTGAGVSKESGIPTFRDPLDGLWSKYEPQQLATRHAFKENPKLVWDWYVWRRNKLSAAKPNPGHFALAQLEDYVETVVCITQNVDDLHEQGGSNNVVHLHGSIMETKCFANCQGDPTLIDLRPLKYDKNAGPPPCPHCGAPIRPNVVWFGEILPKVQLDMAYEAAKACDVMLVGGTSGLVSPASWLPKMAKEAGATVIEVNPDYSMITRIADIKLEAPSGEALPKVIESLAALTE